MIDYENLTNIVPYINYDTTNLTNEGYELKFILDFKNPDLQKIIDRCEETNLLYKIMGSDGRQKHVWIKGWINE